ncbi:MAG TPA: 30S ribosome-binding factor RbfA [Candidatus Dormibacteraeota bacterium]|jgi:ribosome-binding factor A
MSGHRAVQVGAQVREEIMQIIRRDLKDPRIGFVSITEVRMSPDLRSARVRVSVLGDQDEGQATLAGLRSASGLIRHALGRRLENLKFTPELRFELDPSIEYSVRISKTLREILPTPPHEIRTPGDPLGGAPRFHGDPGPGEPSEDPGHGEREETDR